MDVIFDKLTEEEHHKLIDATPLITLLIGYADGDIDVEEAAWAERVTKFRSYTYDADLKHYYQEVNRVFHTRLDQLLRDLPREQEDRQKYLTTKLTEINPILEKLGGEEAYLLYHDFLSFAKHVAKSSGGVLYMANISPAEKELLGLDMLTPINTYPGI